MRKYRLLVLWCVVLFGCGTPDQTLVNPTPQIIQYVMADTVIPFRVIDDQNGDGVAQPSEPTVPTLYHFVDGRGARPLGDASLMWAGGATLPISIELRLPADNEYRSFQPSIVISNTSEIQPVTFLATKLAGHLVQTPTYRGVIVDQSLGSVFASVNGPVPNATFWTPTPDDIATLEAALPAFLQTAAAQRSPDLWQKIPTYVRQYTGIEQNGTRTILINARCDSAAKTQTFENLMINGDA